MRQGNTYACKERCLSTTSIYYVFLERTQRKHAGGGASFPPHERACVSKPRRTQNRPSHSQPFQHFPYNNQHTTGTTACSCVEYNRSAEILDLKRQ